MVKLNVFLICISVMILIFSVIACMEMYAMERAVARGIYSDIADDMQDIGYLNTELANYYQDKMAQMGWQEVASDFYQGTWPRDEIHRARKERNETISLALTVRPSRLAQWIHLFVDGDEVFRFSGMRPSEYFDPGW